MTVEAETLSFLKGLPPLMEDILGYLVPWLGFKFGTDLARAIAC